MTTEPRTVELKAVMGGVKEVGYGHPCYCSLDKCRVRIYRVVDGTSIENLRAY